MTKEAGLLVLPIEIRGIYVLAVFWLVKSYEISLIEKQSS